MERDDFTKDFTKGNSLKWVPRLASLEVVAEQILHYFKPDANQKNLMQLLLLFELGKGYFRLKALFSGNETILMEEQLFTFYLAEKRRNGFLKQKADDIKNLTKSNSKYASKEALLTQIKAVLGVKIKEKEAPKEGQVKDVENPAPALPPTDETVYVEDKENVVRKCNKGGPVLLQ
jgi:hypothetical protein